ncbi:MAG: TRAP transporter substrate-binding protein [Akkermansiaceae bacterium]|nr:TRAP transporter substrate-binding protein [Akkermansiaceae bacterium]
MSKPTSFFIIGILLGVVTAGGWFAWLGQRKDVADSGAKVLQVAHGLPVSHPVHLGLEEMARLVAEKSGGRMKFRVFHSEQLGTEVECLEKAQAGTLAITKVSAGVVGNFLPVYQVFSLPYLFRDEGHFWRVLDGGIGNGMLERLATKGDGAASGLHGLTWYDSGSRSFYTKRPVRGPDDLRGLKIRTMSDPVAMDMVQALGGSPTPIAWGELYTALRQGTVDGAENNPPSLLSSRHFEICKHYILDHHSRIPDVLVMSAAVWDGLNDEEKGWITEAARESGIFQRKIWAEQSDKAIAEIKAAGVEVVEADLEAFAKATQSVIDKHATGEIGGLVEKIRAVE